MPARIYKYLDEMDKLRSQAEDEIDKMLRDIDVKKLLQNRGNINKYFKIIILTYLKEHGQLFVKAKKEGHKLAEDLK